MDPFGMSMLGQYSTSYNIDEEVFHLFFKCQIQLGIKSELAGTCALFLCDDLFIPAKDFSSM